MKLSAAAASVVLLLVPAALAAPRSHANIRAALTKRSPNQLETRAEVKAKKCTSAIQSMGDYYIYEPSCISLIYSCLGAVNETSDIWSSASCVAAATCDGTRNLLTLAQCANDAVTTDDFNYLQYDIYADIVGDCAWDESGCAMTQQNFTDFYYSTLSAVGSEEWPADVSDVVENYWEPIMEWANVDGDDLPYSNFADWLLFSDSYAPETEEDC